MTSVGDRDLRVLLVEDDAPTARTLARMLTEDGYSTEIVFDGAGAIARLGRDLLPDVLLVDYKLPHVDGIAVAAYARTRKPEMRIIFLTSYAEVVARARTALVPAPVILAKPLSYSDLTAELARGRS